MSNADDHFDDFDDHTDLKHLVVGSYLRAWSAVRINPRANPYGWFIDAFAGRGSDASGKPGSPLIACEISREVDARYPPTTDRRRLTTFAVEKRKKTYSGLIETTYACQRDGYVIPLLGSLEQHIDTILTAGSSTDPRLFFLDPFGVKGLRADIIRRILEQAGSEVLLLFNDTGAMRLHGAASKQPESARPDVALSLFGDLDANPARSRMIAAEATGPASEQILRVAFGGDAYERAASEVSKAAARDRNHIWLREYIRTLFELGAQYVVPFSVRDREGRHKYFLLHASTHRRAVHKMKEAIHTAMRRHGTGAQQETLFYHTTVDVDAVVKAIQECFAGRTVGWTGDNPSEAIRAFLVENTDALLGDFPAIQDAMQSRGWLVKEKPRLYKIP